MKKIILFAFSFYDKIAMGISIIFYFTVLFCSIAFYYVANVYLRKKMGYFIYCFYRCMPALTYIAVNFFFRGVVCGAIHHFFHNSYGKLILSLCIVEILMLIFTIAVEKMGKIFFTQSSFSLFLTYHFIMILLNCSLYIEEAYRLDASESFRILIEKSQ